MSHIPVENPRIVLQRDLTDNCILSLYSGPRKHLINISLGNDVARAKAVADAIINVCTLADGYADQS